MSLHNDLSVTISASFVAANEPVQQVSEFSHLLHVLKIVIGLILRAVPEIILRGGRIFLSDPSTPRTHKESELPDPQDTYKCFN